MEKQVLSIERMQHLKELGLDTSKANAVIYTISETESYCGYSRECILIEGYLENYLSRNPTFTLQDILELLPSCIKEDFGDCYYLMIEQLSNDEEKDWNIRYCLSDYSLSKIQFASLNLLDAAYEMLCWCIENNYVSCTK